MSVPNTRIDTATLRAVVEQTTHHLDAMEQTLSALLVVLTAQERKEMPRPRTGFEEAARTLADLMRKRPDIADIAEYQPETVLEDLDNVELIRPLLPRLEALSQRVSDSQLQWRAEAQEPTLAAYNVARTLSKRDGSLVAIIAPMRRVLSNPRRGSGEPKER